MDGVSRMQEIKEKKSMNWRKNNRNYPNEKQKENKLKKKKKTDTASWICGTITKDLTFVSLESEEEKKKSGAKKGLGRNKGWKLLKFGKQYNLQIQGAE